MIKKIISGGQSGADLGGLIAGLSKGLITGGWMPKGWKTENGARPEYKFIFGMQETARNGYTYRTGKNVKDSDGTIIFTTVLTGGSLLTKKFCKDLKKPYLLFDLHNYTKSEEVLKWLKDNEIKTLNVAGHRESKNPGITRKVKKIISLIIERQ